MDGAILPNWFWLIYYSFLLLVFGIGIVNTIKKRMYILSIFAVILTITVPFISMVNSLFLDFGTNELTHLISEFQVGAKWSIFAISGYMYMVVYIFVFLIKNIYLCIKNNNNVSK